MERITVNLDDDVGAKVKAKAESEKRSASGYVELLIEQDLRAAGLLPESDDSAGFFVKLNEALREDKTLRPAIEKLLRKTARARAA